MSLTRVQVWDSRFARLASKHSSAALPLTRSYDGENQRGWSEPYHAAQHCGLLLLALFLIKQKKRPFHSDLHTVNTQVKCILQHEQTDHAKAVWHGAQAVVIVHPSPTVPAPRIVRPGRNSCEMPTLNHNGQPLAQVPPTHCFSSMRLFQSCAPILHPYLIYAPLASVQYDLWPAHLEPRS